jgi:O-antigen/teichoic acid export membrane protein
VTAVVSAKLRAVRADPVLTNAALIFITTALMAGSGAAFWVIAARLASPEDVGLAGSLVSAADSLALFAQLGLNIALLRTLPASDHKAADVLHAAVVVSVGGGCFALAYALLLPLTSPRIAGVLSSPVTIGVFCVLVAATALNVLTDSVFLGINRVSSYLKLNGLLLGATKCTLPFLLAGAGAFGLYGSVGGAVLGCAAASLWVILRRLPGPRNLSPSAELRASRRFAGAGYVTYVLSVLPLLVFPLLVINVLGSAQGAVYFISFQVVTLLHAVVLAVANSTYAASEQAVRGRHDLVRRGGRTLLVCSSAGALAMFVLAPLFLQIFGDHYVAEGTWTLRILSLATVGAAFNYWSAMRLRLASHLRAMILVQLASTAVMLGLAGALAPFGTHWVAAAWGIGHLLGGAVGYVVSRTVAPFDDEAPRLRAPQATPEGAA